MAFLRASGPLDFYGWHLGALGFFQRAAGPLDVSWSSGLRAMLGLGWCNKILVWVPEGSLAGNFRRHRMA
jgi:hypothetical protein